MTAYGNTGSGVRAYEEGPDYLRVQFKNGVTYTYTAASVGQANLDAMKQLAQAGRGLNSFIARYVKYSYASKS